MPHQTNHIGWIYDIYKKFSATETFNINSMRFFFWIIAHKKYKKKKLSDGSFTNLSHYVPRCNLKYAAVYDL